ncbi:MAG: type II secretion system F family protein [Gammaproteobacteria bacterium]|nr:type II secretion system F family protein [Gammaproteobacteria bacterium]
MPAADAVTRAARTVTNRLIADELAACAAPLAAGASVAATLGECRCLDAEAIALLHSGEGAGRLAETLLRYAETERARLGEAEDRMATWAPRLVYLLVLLWLAGRFI